MYELQDYQLVLVLIHNRDEVQACVSLVDDLVLLVVDEITHLGPTCYHQLVHLSCCRTTSLRMRCFYCCDRFSEYHFVSRERPCRLIRKKQWIIVQIK